MHKQAGMTLPSMLIVGLVAVGLLKAAFAVFPMYFDNRMLTTVLDKMEQNADLPTTSSAMTKYLSDTLSRNNLDISLDDANIQLNSSGGISLDWNYERRANWFGNIDIVVKFNQEKEFN